MKKKGFTLLELIAGIAILSIIALIATPGILKSYNKSKQQAMTIQESKLVEAGDILLDDYCNDAISDEYKKKCDIIYQELDKENSNRLSGEGNKTYKYICVKDIKKLKYYTEELKYGGDSCQGVVIYEIDNKSKLQTDSFSYVKCSDVYESDPERKLLLEELFSNCFTSDDTEQNYLENKKYNVTVKYVVNDVNGMQVANNKKFVVKAADFRNDVIFSFPVPVYRPQNDPNVYNAAINTGRHKVTYNRVTDNGEEVIQVTDMPESDMTITVVYTVGRQNVVSNYYYFNPNTNYGTSETDKIKKSDSKEGFTMETVELDVPLEITSSGEKYKLYSIYLNKAEVASIANNTLDSFSKVVEISTSDKIYDFVYQREAFNVTYNNNGGTGCTTGRVKYNKPYGTLCTPTKVGFDFKHWSLTADGNSPISSTTNNNKYQDLTLYAVWTAHSYNINYALNSGTMNPAGPSSAQYDSVINVVNPSKKGYTFTGWTISSGLNTTTAKHGTSGSSVTNAIASASTKIKSTYFKNLTPTNNGNVTMTANFNANTYNIAFDCNGGTGSMTTITGVKYDETKSLTNNGCSKTGYNFGGWSYNGNTYANQVGVKNLTATNGDTVTLKAIWNLKMFTITYDYSDGGPGTYAPTQGGYNSTVTVSNPVRPGWTFTGWTVSGTGASINGTTLKIGSSNVTLKAHFKTHILTYIDYMWNNARSANSLTNNDPAGNKRYTGANPNNYVKFNDESWRMIGVFNVSSANRLKIVRSSGLYSGSFDVSSSSVMGGYGVNDWTQSDVAYTLNNYYLAAEGSTCKYSKHHGEGSISSWTGNCSSVKRLSAAAQAMVSSVRWNTGAIHYGATYNQQTYNNISAAAAYNAERSSATGKQCTNSKWTYCKNDSVTRYTTWTGKVGLPYPSDWAYASGNSSCKNTLTNSTNCSKNNWLHHDKMWTMTPGAWWNLDNCSSQIIDNELYANWGHVNGPIKPTVYLNTNLYFTAGTGTSSNPYVISQG